MSLLNAIKECCPWIPFLTTTAQNINKTFKIDPTSPLHGAQVLTSPPQCRIEKNAAGLHEPNLQCSICISDIETAKEATILGCGHAFHSPCIAMALKEKRECPFDRQTINSSVADKFIEKNLPPITQQAQPTQPTTLRHRAPPPPPNSNYPELEPIVRQIDEISRTLRRDYEDHDSDVYCSHLRSKMNQLIDQLPPDHYRLRRR